jgi:hypothetical protein
MSDSINAEQSPIDATTTQTKLHELLRTASLLESSEVPLVQRDAALIVALVSQALELFEAL